MADLIDRVVKIEDVIDILKQNGIIQDNEIGNLIVEEISRIPPADTDKHAYWRQVISNCSLYECSECGRTVRYNKDINILSIDDKYPYCHCGCRMNEV